MPTTAVDFKTHIKDVPDFPSPGILFRDIQPLLSNPKVYQQAIDELVAISEPADYYVGIDSRGFLFASSMALKTNAGIILLRKKGKLPPPTIAQEYSLEYGTDTLEIQPGTGRVVIVDDVYATGGTMDAAEILCKKAGYTVVDRVVLIDLEFLHGPNDVKSLVQYNG